ncbi:MAG: Repressor CsoR of the copZA operon, partial [uncultured Actinomycetospora sp.]
ERLRGQQGRPPAAPAPDRGAGPRHREDDRGRQVLHRRAHPGLGGHARAAERRARAARGAHGQLRGRRREGRRRRGGREGPGSLRGHRPPRPLL